MSLLRIFTKEYPLHCFLTVAALLFASIAEGFGISALIPLLNIIINPQYATLGEPASSGDNFLSAIDNIIQTTVSQLGVANAVASILTFFFICILVKCVLVLIANRQIGYTVAHITTNYRLKFLNALFVTRWIYFLSQPVGRLTNAVATEAARAGKAFKYGAKMASYFIEALVYTMLALFISWQATLIAFAVGLLVIFVLKRYIRKARRAGNRQTKLLQSFIALMTDSLNSIKPLKAMAREDAADAVLQKKANGLNRALQKQVVSKANLNAMQEPIVMAFLAITLYVALIYFKMSLVTLMAMIYVIRRVLKGVQQVQREYQHMMIFESAVWSIRDKIEAADNAREKSEGTRPPTFDKNIRLENISFAYEDKQILNEICMDLSQGAFIALVGPSGVGKTTIADLIIGLLHPQKGQIKLDDIDLEEVDIHRWRRMIGYVPQDTILLHDTIAKNISLGSKSVKTGDIERSLHASGAWDFVSQLPQGIQTVVGERGSKLSGGQRQRIAIARAMVHAPKLLILDEATTALDPDTEVAICDTLKKLRGQYTILAISHQSAMLEAADIAFRLEDGKIETIKAPLMPPTGSEIKGDGQKNWPNRHEASA